MRSFLFQFFLFSFSALHAQERLGPYKIHKFVDGDTFWVKMEYGKAEKSQLKLTKKYCGVVKNSYICEHFFKPISCNSEVN